MPSIFQLIKKGPQRRAHPSQLASWKALSSSANVKIPGTWVALAEYLTKISTKQGKALCPQGPKTPPSTTHRYQVAWSGETPLISKMH